MKLKTLTARARPSGPARRRRASHEREQRVRPVQPEGQPRFWSLLLPPGYSSNRR